MKWLFQRNSPIYWNWLSWLHHLSHIHAQFLSFYCCQSRLFCSLNTRPVKPELKVLGYPIERFESQKIRRSWFLSDIKLVTADFHASELWNISVRAFRVFLWINVPSWIHRKYTLEWCPVPHLPCSLFSISTTQPNISQFKSFKIQLVGFQKCKSTHFEGTQIAKRSVGLRE